MFFPYKSGHRRGVAILISNKVSFEKTYEIGDKAGRLILVRGKTDGNPITSLNIYLLQEMTLTFFKKWLILWLQKQKILWLVDEIYIYSQSWTPFGGKSCDRKSLYKKVNLLFEEVGLIDIWWDIFPNRRDYTHYYAPHSFSTRID